MNVRNRCPAYASFFAMSCPREYVHGIEVAEALAVDRKTVDHLFEPDGRRGTGPKLMGFQFVGRGRGIRPHKRILRDSVTLLLIEGAGTVHEEGRARLVEMLGKMSVRDLASIQAAINERLSGSRRPVHTQITFQSLVST